MKKIIMPGKALAGYPERFCNIHIKIEYTDGKLSISGVVGAKSNGDCYGSCGQCIDSLDEIKQFADGWDVDMVQKLKEIWERWHLNDTRAECEHQRELGWRELAKKKVKLYHWSLKSEFCSQQRKIQDKAIDTLKTGKQCKLTKEDAEILGLSYSITTDKDHLTGKLDKYYKPYEGSSKRHIETKTLGWLYPMDATGAGTDDNKHPDGLLCKPCPVCGYKYGSSWNKEEVPEDVIQWLFNLPEASTACAWSL